MNTGHNVPAGCCERGGGVENRAVGTQEMGLEQISSLSRQNRPECFTPSSLSHECEFLCIHHLCF